MLVVALSAWGCGGDGDGSRDASAGDAVRDSEAGDRVAGDSGMAVRVPEEVADEEALSHLTDWRALPLFRSGRTQRASSTDRETGDPAPLPIVANGNR